MNCGRQPKQHLVDGRWVTLTEMAAELGIKRKTLENQMYRNGGGSLNVAVHQIRDNLVLNGHKRSGRHMVDGRWTTMAEMAEALGINYSTLQHYVKVHGCTLAEAVADYREGRVIHGRSQKVHIVDGKETTVAEAARRCGVSIDTIRWRMSHHKKTLRQTVRYYERKKAERAAGQILDILKGP